MSEFIRDNLTFSKENMLKLSLLAVLLLSGAVFSLNIGMTDIQAFIQENQSQAILISLVIYVLFGFTFLPSIPLTLFIAVLIGPLQAAIVAALGNTIAAFFEYQIGKTVGDVVDFEEKRSKLPFGLGKLPVKSPYFMLAARSIPAAPRAFSMVCGAYEVPMGVYLWTTSLTYFISSAILAYGGEKLIDLI